MSVSFGEPKTGTGRAWTLTAHEPHGDRVYLANGYLGTALDFAGGALFESRPAPCYVRGLYASGEEGIDRLAAVPCWSRLRYGHRAALEGYRRDLDLRHGILRTEMKIRERRGTVDLIQEIFVSRADPHSAAVRLTATPSFSGEIEFLSEIDAGTSVDLRTFELGAHDATLWITGQVPPYQVRLGQTISLLAPEGKVLVSRESERASACVRVQARAGQPATVAQVARLVTSLESDDPLAAARAGAGSYEELRRDHIAAWERLWATDIQIEGDPEVQQFARAGLFYLWSTVHEGDEWSIAPMGLSSNGYNGHIFWDAELWMYPSLLVTHPELGKSCVAYRERTLGAARERAFVNGRRGAQFPWEAAYTGEEMTPYWAETRDFQLHITADVAIGQWWFYLTTGDVEWLRNHGFPVIRECAEYWVSRVEHNVDQDRYEVSDVVCADEYAAHVDNDAFTNASVRRALEIAVRAAEIVGEAPPEAWSVIAERMYIPYDERTQRHVEFDGYDGCLTKQADVELLAFPLEATTDLAQVARDLDYYAGVIDPDGPAMSFSIYSIVSAQLGRAGAAYDYLKRSYEPNTRRPFWSFSETPTNEEYHFCTGIGGALQALLFGFSGLRLREHHLMLSPILPDHWEALRLQNIYVSGARTDIEIARDVLTVRRALEQGTVVAEIHWNTRRVSLEWPGDGSPADLELQDGSGQLVLCTRLASGGSLPLPDDSEAGFWLRLRSQNGGPLMDLFVRAPARV